MVRADEFLRWLWQRLRVAAVLATDWWRLRKMILCRETSPASAVNTRFERKDAHQFYESLGYTRNGFRFVKNLAAAGQ
jgi:hypothetical protein